MSTTINKSVLVSRGSTTLDYVNKLSPDSWKKAVKSYTEKKDDFGHPNSRFSIYDIVTNKTTDSYRTSIIENSYSSQYIINALEKAKNMSFDEDDEISVQPVLECVWDLTKDFLIGYLEWIDKNYGILIEEPDISALPNGSLDILWYNRKGKILINIDNSSDKKAYFYSDFHNRKNPMKGNVEINSEIDESLAIRIKKLAGND